MPNIKLSDLVGHSTGLDKPAPTVDNMTKVLNVFQNPSTLNRDVFKNTNFSDWRQSVLQVRDYYKSNIGQNIDPNLKLEIQTQMRRDQEIAARQQYLDTVAKVKDRVASERQGLLNDIKAKKFPLYSAKQKTESGGFTTVSRLPDMAARAAGASELLVASQTPLKYISGALLENYAAAGRTDLVSALVERSMMNQGELQGKQFQEIYQFGLEYYERLGVQPDRQLYKQVRGIEKHLLPHVSSTMDFDNMRVVMAETAYQSELNNDNLLEM